MWTDVGNWWAIFRYHCIEQLESTRMHFLFDVTYSNTFYLLANWRFVVVLVKEEIGSAEERLNCYVSAIIVLPWAKLLLSCSTVSWSSCCRFSVPVSSVSCSFLQFSTFCVGLFLLFPTLYTFLRFLLYLVLWWCDCVMGIRCCVPGCKSNFARSKAKSPGLKEKNDFLNKSREVVKSSPFSVSHLRRKQE